MLWFLNEYIIDNKLYFKIVKCPFGYSDNYYLVNTYVLSKNRFIEYRNYINSIKIPEKTMFKKLLGFFNKL